MGRTSGQSIQLILKLLSTGPKTRLEIVKETGLSYSVVCKYISQCSDDGLIDVDKDLINDYKKSKNCPVRKRIAEQNSQKVLQAIKDGNDTYHKLSKVTGLSTTTIHVYITKFINDGIVSEDFLKKGEQDEELKQERAKKRELRNQQEKERRRIERDILKFINQYNIYTYSELKKATNLDDKTLSYYINKLIEEGKLPADVLVEEPSYEKKVEDKISNKEKAYYLICDFAKKYRANKINLNDVTFIYRIMQFYPEFISVDTTKLMVKAFEKIGREDLAEEFCNNCLKLINKKENRKTYDQVLHIKAKLEEAKRKAMIEHMIVSGLEKGNLNLFDISGMIPNTDYTEVLQEYHRIIAERRKIGSKPIHNRATSKKTNIKPTYDGAR